MAGKDTKKKAARKPRAQKVEEAPEVEESEEIAEPVEEAPEAPVEEAEEVPEAPVDPVVAGPMEAPKPERRGIFPKSTMKGGFEMRPATVPEVSLKPCGSLDEAIERCGGEEAVHGSRETLTHYVVVFGDSHLKLRFPKAE